MNKNLEAIAYRIDNKRLRINLLKFYLLPKHRRDINLAYIPKIFTKSVQFKYVEILGQ